MITPLFAAIFDHFIVSFLLSLCATLLLTMIAHKAGLALMARWLGFEVTSFGLGTARPLLVMRWGKTLLYLCVKGLPNCQVTVLFPDDLRKPQLIAYCAGGQLGYVVLAAIGAAGCYLYPKGVTFWGTLAVVNVCGILLSEEWRFAWRLWREHEMPSAILPALSTLHRMRALWQAIGDKRAEAVHLLGVSDEWLMLGDTEHARTLLRDAEALHSDLAPGSEGRSHVRHAILESDAGNYDAAALEFTAAMRFFEAAGNMNEQVHTGLQHACCAAENGRPEVAEQLLQEWGTHPQLADAPVLQVIAGRAQLVVHGQSMTTEQVEEIQVRYAALAQRSAPPALVDWCMYRRFTAVYAKLQDTKRAQTTYRLASKAFIRLGAVLPADEDFQRLVHCGQEFDRKTADLFQMANAACWSECVAEFNAELQRETQASEQTQREQRERQQQRERWRLRIGLALLPLNVLAFVILLMNFSTISGVLRDSWASMELFFGLLITLVLLGISVFGGVLYHILYFVAGWFSNRSQEQPGSMTISLAVLPWLVPPLAIMAPLIRLWFQ